MTPTGRWVAARDVRVGDTIQGMTEGVGTVEALWASCESTTVYNIQVSRYHSYAVGREGWLVHNKPMSNAIVLQSGKKKILQSTLDALGLERDEARRAMENIKEAWSLPNDFHESKIWNDGSVTHAHTGENLGNLYDG
jgi:hypothetical protein